MSRRKVRKHPHVGFDGAQRDFVKLIGELARGPRNHGEVFTDFLELSFCSIAQATRRATGDVDRANDLEARYTRIVEKRGAEYVRRMPELFGLLSMGLTEPCDFLGAVSGELGSLNEHMGQFFTPFHVSAACAQMLIDHDTIAAAVAERGYFTIDEPAAGAGGMLLAVAKVVEGLGFDVTHHMRARATDLSATAYQMCFVQLSLRGIAATVHHGNTLTLEQFDAQVTPGLLLQVAQQRSQGLVGVVRAASEAVDSMAAIERTESPQETPATTGKHGVFDGDQAHAIPAENARGQLDLFAGVG